MLWESALPSLFLISAVQAAVQLPPSANEHQLEHAYFISFKDNTADAVFDSHLDWIKELSQQHEEINIRHVFRLAFQGYSAALTPDVLEKIRHREEIASIDHVGTAPAPVFTTKGGEAAMAYEADVNNRFVEPSLVQGLANVPGRGWNAARISHKNFTKGYGAGTWVRDRNLGKGVTVYVLDTGVNIKNPGFRGTPVSFGRNLVGSKRGPKTNDNDNHGHGTMCAGVIAGDRHGLAPEAKMVAVKIANDQNRSACDDTVAGIEWVMSQAGDNNMKVISMSHYGFTGLPDVQQAVSKATDKGVHFVVCAGNHGVDACRVQPNAARNVISVASTNGFNKIPVKGTTDAGGREMESSNIGKCITIFAPGTRVPTLSNKNQVPYFSWGTSVAAPQVAALIANRLSAVGKQSPAQMKKWLQDTAIKGQVEGDLKGSPNLILYNGLGA